MIRIIIEYFDAQNDLETQEAKKLGLARPLKTSFSVESVTSSVGLFEIQLYSCVCLVIVLIVAHYKLQKLGNVDN